MTRDVDFPPLRNGVDYLLDAVQRLRGTPDAKNLKYAVLHLHAGMEVLLKYRLICEDWRLILDDEPASVTEQDYVAGKFRSIGVSKTIQRLNDLEGITVTSSQKRAVTALEKLRNQLQHHGLSSTAQAVEAQAVKALTFLMHFIGQYITPDDRLDPSDKKFLERTLPDIRGPLGEIKALVETRMQDLRPVLEAVAKTWCPECGQPAVLLASEGVAAPANIPQHEQPRCAFCTRSWPSRKDYVEDFTFFNLGLSDYGVADGGDPPTSTCEQCYEDMVVSFDFNTGNHGTSYEARCFACEEEFNDVCGICHQQPIYNPNVGEGCDFCSACTETVFNKD
ncbi:hypothetical protein KCV87_00835 [Actinosynnema pretiosum subsp. pretiosum]|uniref:Uncharacterized protein n=1 Tax=Actinosynnema pretiosum subsp. pretiosum TaxID=103721 RepID=A0AA45L720_9PSEU|nr:hypothetical protein KCV87_00835 [Actinosynnema pretiosum subsp. pretiosum]